MEWFDTLPVSHCLTEYDKGTPSMTGGASSGIIIQGQVRVHRICLPLIRTAVHNFTHSIYRASEFMLFFIFYFIFLTTRK